MSIKSAVANRNRAVNRSQINSALLRHNIVPDDNFAVIGIGRYTVSGNYVGIITHIAFLGGGGYTAAGNNIIAVKDSPRPGSGCYIAAGHCGAVKLNT